MLARHLPFHYLHERLPMFNKIPPIILTALLFLIYMRTLAPDITWANDGADGGDFITAAATGGIPHPTGYPVYILLSKAFQFLPVGSLAFRTNLLSALVAVVSVVLIYGILVWLPNSPVYGCWLAGLAAGFSFGLSPVFWSQAVITEVYTLHTALAVLAIFLALYPSKNAWIDRLCGVALGLALGNHLTSVFFLPPIILARTWKERLNFEWGSLLRIFTWLGIALSPYIILPIRAMYNPPINWGNPVTLRQFFWLISGEMYQQNLLKITAAEFWGRANAWVTLLLQQIGFPGIVLALIGLIYYFKPSRLYFITIYVMIVFSLFAMFYHTGDSYVYLLPSFLSFAIWIGIGIGCLVQSAKLHNLQMAFFVLFACFYLGWAVSHWSQVDAAHDMRAEQFGLHEMKILPERAIVMADGDRAVFTLWYFHFALKQRPDLVILASDMLAMDWYRENMQRTYPQLNWTGDVFRVESFAAHNIDHPICYVSYWDRNETSCNTPLRFDK
jgi:hypothetical protein